MLMPFYGLLPKKIIEKKRVSPTSDGSKENNTIEQYFPNTALFETISFNYLKNIVNLMFAGSVKNLLEYLELKEKYLIISLCQV